MYPEHLEDDIVYNTISSGSSVSGRSAACNRQYRPHSVVSTVVVALLVQLYWRSWSFDTEGALQSPLSSL